MTPNIWNTNIWPWIATLFQVIKWHYIFERTVNLERTLPESIKDQKIRKTDVQVSGFKYWIRKQKKAYLPLIAVPSDHSYLDHCTSSTSFHFM